MSASASLAVVGYLARIIYYNDCNLFKSNMIVSVTLTKRKGHVKDAYKSNVKGNLETERERTFKD